MKITDKKTLLMSYEAQLKELEILVDIQAEVLQDHSEKDITPREHQLLDDEVIKALFSKEVLRRRIERLKVELENEEIES
jgi:hypothetical protein